VRDRPVQFLSVLLALLALVGAGALLPRIVTASDEAKLRYTDVSLEGAPPIVAVGAAVGRVGAFACERASAFVVTPDGPERSRSVGRRGSFRDSSGSPVS
jgi:hypothetical protein